MTRSEVHRIGVDVGSTTLKMIVLNSNNEIVYKVYKRHKASFNSIFVEEIRNICLKFPFVHFMIGVTGSAGMGIAERTGIPFVQEVVASIEVIRRMYSDTHTMIDLGGEDAKMVFFKEGKQPDIRMNGNCAGGTGAFIDQMADLMNISITEIGDQALKYEKTYPIASRCGVFAKTDVQNLIARNIPVPDISMSILQAVALQSITTLARGMEIRPKILCIGGPLTFIPALRNSFRLLLDVHNEDLVVPENGEYFPAWGAALYNKETAVFDLRELINKLERVTPIRKDILDPLFNSENDYLKWKNSRRIKHLNRTRVEKGENVDCFLGIDSGSTTTKILVMDTDCNLVYNYYAGNEGNPLKKVLEGLNLFYEEAKEKGINFRFLSSAATGYGEDLVKSALNLDFGIVETMAHLSGAQHVDPEVSFVLDIGGQDMKSIFTNKEVISNIELNEACSSGCGSFLQNFASTMNMSLSEFTQVACLAKYPSDLGSRCTVFMNSKVKQALRENASLGDIASGLAYSVVKNCLFKVLKISNLNQLGDHIVVQGGTFRNDAVFRALELLSGKMVSSTDYPELMGALGAALYAKKMWQKNKHVTDFDGKDSLPDINAVDTKELQCKGCANLCSVLRFKFSNHNICYAGNKCEKIFFNKNTAPIKGYNAFDLKNEVLFNGGKTTQFSEQITIGIPRVLNIYENYPFWQALFSECGFKVQLSSESNISLYQKGAGSVMSDNICFPAKLVHGHIHELAEMKVDRIFYPIVIKEDKEFNTSNNSFNCPVVSGYPDVVRSSMEPELRYGIIFDKPVVTFCNKEALKKSCYKYLSSLGVCKNNFEFAFKKALDRRELVTKQLIREQQKILHQAIKDRTILFIVAGRPYHADPLIHQKVGQILSDLGITVLTDDVFRDTESSGFGKLNIVSQWSYPNRVVQAAMQVAQMPENIQLIQLNSFGCGPDSFLMDEVGDILRQAGKPHTILRIDEIASPGSIRLRLRSLIESLKVAHANEQLPEAFQAYERTYIKEDRKKTILAPWFSDFISPFIPVVGELIGYKIVNLPKSNKNSAEAGLKYGHNEVCYPLTLVLGDIITALQSGNYDLDDVVVAITQTGGQCRATNYLAQIKSGMKNAGFSEIPVLVVSTGIVYQNEQKAFKVPVMKIINILIYAILYADALQQMYGSTIIRERNKGETQQLFNFYVEEGIKAIRANNSNHLLNLLDKAVSDFNNLKIESRDYVKVGLIGEIYVKYNSYGQAHIGEWLRSQGMEVVTPPIIDFVMQYFVNYEVNSKNGVERGSFIRRYLNPWFWKYMNKRINNIENVLKNYRFYHPYESVYTKAKYASEILDLSNQFGEGWNIAAEVACYSHRGINRIVCIQPFGCIANHIVAKGIEKRLKKHYPSMNLLSLDIDGGIAEVNLQNRLHFLIN